MRFIDADKLICLLEQFSEICGPKPQAVIKQVIYMIGVMAEEVE